MMLVANKPDIDGIKKSKPWPRKISVDGKHWVLPEKLFFKIMPADIESYQHITEDPDEFFEKKSRAFSTRKMRN
jgi:hypothetical protein